MDYSTQKILRILTFAFLLLFLVSAIYNPNQACKCSSYNALLQNWSSPSLIFLITTIPAYLYCQFVQNVILQKITFNNLNKHICDFLIAISGVQIPKNKKDKVNRYLLYNVFYKLVDNDETLKLRSNDNRLNGYFVSLSCDAIILLIINIIAQSLFNFYSLDLSRIILMRNSFIGIIIFMVFLIPLTYLHYRSTTIQLKYIQKEKMEEVRNYLQKYINS